VSEQNVVNLWQIKFRDIIQAVSCCECNKLQDSIQTPKLPPTFFTCRAIKFCKKYCKQQRTTINTCMPMQRWES